VNFTDTFTPGPVSDIQKTFEPVGVHVKTTISWKPAWGKLFGRFLNRLVINRLVIPGNIGAQ
jgi:hypothetical protein